jgi:hypothetical protein
MRQETTMNIQLLTRPCLCVGIVALCAGATSPAGQTQQDPDRTTVSFSDPSRPGLLHLALVTGNIVVKGADVKEVTIETHARHADAEHGPRSWRSRGPGQPGDDPEEEARGLHRLTQQPALHVEEQDNRMSVSAPNFKRPADLEIQVPRRTNLELSTVSGGDIHVEGVDGELEVSNVNGAITLTAVGGSVVAHTLNGKVSAALTRVAPQKPMAFSSLNGAIDITLPSATKANLKLQTDNGSAFTDFDLHTLPQPSDSVVEDTRRSGGRYRLNVNKVIYGTINGGGADIEVRTFNGNIYVRKAG